MTVSCSFELSALRPHRKNNINIYFISRQGSDMYTQCYMRPKVQTQLQERNICNEHCKFKDPCTNKRTMRKQACQLD